jgi:hypothetical protein
VSFGSGHTAKLPEPDQSSLGIGPTQLSTNQQARPVPVLYGKQRMGVTFLSDAFDAYYLPRTQDTGKDSIVVGYYYFSKIAFLIGHGPVDIFEGAYLDTNEFISPGRIVRDTMVDKVAYVKITDGGQGYQPNTYDENFTFVERTKITFKNAAGDVTGIGAVGRAIVNNGRVTHIAVMKQGEGYTLPPMIQIDGLFGAGSGAKATAVIGSQSWVEMTMRSKNVPNQILWKLYWGTETQDFDPDLLKLASDRDYRMPSPNDGRSGGPRSYDNSEQDHSAYIGQCYVVATGSHGGATDFDHRRGMGFGYQKTNLQNIEVVVGRYPDTFFSLPVSPNLGDDINMSNCVSDALTNTRYGAGQSVNRLSSHEFFQVFSALQGYADFGISPVFTRQEDLKTSIVKLLENFDGYYTILPSGEFAIGLAREIGCADPEVIEFDETCLVDPPSLSPDSWSKTYNFVYVTFKNRDANWNDDAAPAPDLGNFQITGEPQTLTLDRPMVTQQILADSIAKNAAFMQAIPRTQGTIRVRKSKLRGLQVGGGLKLSWNHYNMCRLYGRVLEISVEDPYQPVATITFEVDRGFVIDGGYSFHPTPLPPIGSTPVANPATNELAFEIPFFKTKGEKPYVAFLFRWPASVTSYVPYVNDGMLRPLPIGSTVDFFGVLSTTIGLTEEQVSVSIDGDSDITRLLPQVTPEQGSADSILLIIGDEIMSIHSTNLVDGPSNTWSMSAIRERYDTKRFQHNAGDICYIVYSGGMIAQSVITGNPDAAGDVEAFRIQTMAAGAALDLSLADEFSLTFVDRAKRPWKPRNLQVNGVLHYESAHAEYSTGDDIHVKWTPVNRDDGSADFNQAFIPDLWQLEFRKQSDPTPSYPDLFPIYALSAAASVVGYDIANDDIVENLGEVDLVLRIFSRDGSGNVSLNYDEIFIDKV